MNRREFVQVSAAAVASTAILGSTRIVRAAEPPIRLKKAVMENDALLFRVEAKDNRIAKLVAENAEITKRYHDLYDTLEGSDDPDVG